MTVNNQQKAKEFFKEHKLKIALKLTLKAKEVVQRALRLVEEDVTPQMVQNAIQQNERLIEKGV